MPSKKIERRDSPKEMETRNHSGEFRSVGEDGVFEGYLTVWDTVDDYNSQFQRGAFSKTIQERGSKVKVFYDHEHLIGSSVELREDDHGLFGKGKLNLSVPKAQEAYAFMKDGTLEGLSFGFRTIKDGMVNSIRQIKEAQLYEFGPVIFPAGEDSLITDVRATNFNESMSEEELRRKQGVLMDSLWTTLSDIWWDGDTSADNVAGIMDSALSDFHGAYMEYVGEWVNRYWANSESRESPLGNSLSVAMGTLLEESRKSIEDLAGETEFTVAELQELRKGKLIENRAKLSKLSDKVASSHREIRNTAVETLCTELRSNFSESEKKRVMALLKPVETRQSKPESATDLTEMLTYFKNEQSTGE